MVQGLNFSSAAREGPTAGDKARGRLKQWKLAWRWGFGEREARALAIGERKGRARGTWVKAATIIDTARDRG